MPGIRKRYFVQMFGYEPVDAEEQRRRNIREMARFHKTWNVKGNASALAVSPDEFVAHWAIETRGPNWDVATDFYILRWDDIVRSDVSMNDWRRVPLGIAALAEFVLTGTAIRYLVLSRRYGCFFLVPIFAIAGLIWLSVSASWSVLVYADLPYPSLLTPVVAVAVFAALWRLISRRVHLRLALDDWCCARSMVHRSRPELEERLNRFAEELVRLASEPGVDEIVVHGHSLGAPLALLVMDRALALDPQFGQGGAPIRFATTGSSLLKLALHPAAGWLRESVGRVANAPAIYWVEFQSANDFISMYNIDPVGALGMQPTDKPIIKLIEVPPMLEEATYKHFRFNFWRIHRQPRMGNERRYFYDYFMLSCGPVAVTEWVGNSDRTVAAFATDGALAAEDDLETASLTASARGPGV